MFSTGWTWQGFFRDFDPCWFEQRVVNVILCDLLTFVPLCGHQWDWQTTYYRIGNRV